MTDAQRAAAVVLAINAAHLMTEAEADELLVKWMSKEWPQVRGQKQ